MNKHKWNKAQHGLRRQGGDSLSWIRKIEALGLLAFALFVSSASIQTGPVQPRDDSGTSSDSDPGCGAIEVGQTEPGCSGNFSPGSSGFCGDHLKQLSELCDGDDLGGQTCESLGYPGGALACMSHCGDFDRSACIGPSTCGNLQLDGLLEVCDGDDLGGQTCQSLGYGEGLLACADNCAEFDVESCAAPPSCGNNLRDHWLELCDGEDLGGLGCDFFGFACGELRCSANCSAYDTSACFGDPQNLPDAGPQDLVANEAGYVESNICDWIDAGFDLDSGRQGDADFLWDARLDDVQGFDLAGSDTGLADAASEDAAEFCDGVDAFGDCLDDVLRYCQDGELITVDCQAGGDSALVHCGLSATDELSCVGAQGALCVELRDCAQGLICTDYYCLPGSP